jgi:hypothetical protein
MITLEINSFSEIRNETRINSVEEGLCTDVTFQKHYNSLKQHTAPARCNKILHVHHIVIKLLPQKTMNRTLNFKIKIISMSKQNLKNASNFEHKIYVGNKL